MSVPSLTVDRHCFVCGPDNTMGLRMIWQTEGNKTRSRFIPEKHHQGWVEIVHGGLLSAVLDEAITRLAWEVHGESVTAELNVRFLKPAKVGEELSIVGEVAPKAGRLIKGKSEIRNLNGDLIAQAEGKIIRKVQKK